MRGGIMLKRLIKEAIHILTNEHGFIAPQQANMQRQERMLQLGGGGGMFGSGSFGTQGGPMQPPEGGWGGAAPTMGQVNFPAMLEGPGPTPTAGWYEGLDENIRAGIEEPFERQMEGLFESLAGRGTMGSARAGISGAGTDVLAEYQTKAAPIMAQSAWNMMMPGMMMPYEAAMQQYTTQAEQAMRKYETEAGMWGKRAELGFGGAKTGFEAMMEMMMQQKQLQHEKSMQAQGQGQQGAWGPAMSPFEKKWLSSFGELPVWGTRSGEYERENAYPSAWGF